MKRVRGRVFDFLVLISALAVTAGVAIGIKRLLYGKAPTTEEIFYIVNIGELDTELCDNIRLAEELIAASSKKPLGEVVDIRVSPAYREIFSEADMTMLSSPVPGKSRVILTVKGLAERGGGFSVGGIRLLIGEKITFRASNLVFDGEIERIIL